MGGLDLKTLYNWQYRLKKKGLLENSSGRFAPPAPYFQKVVVAPEAFRGGEVRLHWPSGFVLEFESGVDLGYVERLLEVLGGIPGC